MALLKRFRSSLRKGFTLIELITVIAIIAILMGLLLPAVTVVRNTANKTKAKSDALGIVTAVKAYYTDYGHYPGTPTSDVIIGPSGVTGITVNSPAGNWYLMDVLRNVTDSQWMLSGTSNPRGQIYLDVPNAKGTPPKGGMVSGNSGVLTAGSTTVYGGDFVDPWGEPYFIAIDYNYDNVIDVGSNIWSDVNTTSSTTSVLRTGVIVWSVGIDGQWGTKGNGILNSSSTAPASSDDVVSFQ